MELGISLVATDVMIRVGLKILGAIVLWVVGRIVIGFAARLVGRVVDRRGARSDARAVGWHHDDRSSSTSC